MRWWPEKETRHPRREDPRRRHRVGEGRHRPPPTARASASTWTWRCRFRRAGCPWRTLPPRRPLTSSLPKLADASEQRGDVDHRHPRPTRGLEALLAVLEDETVLRRRAQTAGGLEKQIRRELGTTDIVEGHDGVEQRREAEVVERQPYDLTGS